MQLRLLPFAQTRRALGFAEREIECEPSESPLTILQRVAPGFDPRAQKVRVALDGEYREWDEPVGAAQEMALLPPVSGG